MNSIFSRKNIAKHLIPNVGTLVMVALMLFTYTAFAAPNYEIILSTFPYQGTLTDSNGNPVNGNVNMVFSLYNVASGGTPLWQESRTGANAVPVSNGLFQVMLGSLSPIPDIWDSGIIYLGIKIGTDSEMTPREIIGSVPNAINANNAVIADQALTVPDGSITNSKLSLQGNINLGTSTNAIALTGSYPYLGLTNTGGGIRDFSSSYIYLFLDADDNDTSSFRVYSDVDSAVTGNRIFMLEENGNLYITGNLTSGAYIERNLLSQTEQELVSISRFSQGDVLCWDAENQILEKCDSMASPLFVAIADENGKPIILGAEPVKVLGPVQAGDLLVSSDTPGYAIGWSQISDGTPPESIVIGKALESTQNEYDSINVLIK